MEWIPLIMGIAAASGTIALAFQAWTIAGRKADREIVDTLKVQVSSLTNTLGVLNKRLDACEAARAEYARENVELRLQLLEKQVGNGKT